MRLFGIKGVYVVCKTPFNMPDNKKTVEEVKKIVLEAMQGYSYHDARELIYKILAEAKKQAVIGLNPR
jgi:hypothetical protein